MSDTEIDTTPDVPFDWQPLGEGWWREAGEQFNASEKQLKFACAKHRGCGNAQAAREAGYSGGDQDTIRQSAYRVFRSNVCQGLLALAAAESKGESAGHVDDAEVRRVLDKLIRGSDPAIRIRAIEALDKRNANAAAAGRAPDDDGFLDWRTTRDFTLMPRGAAAWLCMFSGQGGWIGNLPMFHDVYQAVQRDELAVMVWNYLRDRPTVSKDSHACLDKQIADPTYQLAARKKIWAEIGIEIEAPPGAKVEPIDTPISESPQQGNE